MNREYHCDSWVENVSNMNSERVFDAKIYDSIEWLG